MTGSDVKCWRNSFSYFLQNVLFKEFDYSISWTLYACLKDMKMMLL